ncbi:MAG: RICIN domain-containing protein [Mycobacterium sp.]
MSVPARVRTGPNSSYCLDVEGFGTHDGARVELWSCSGGPNQKWYFLRPSPNSGRPNPEDFQVESAHSGKCLDVTGISSADGVGMQQWGCAGPPGQNQHWRIG